MTRIKICGITNLDDALLAVSLGADEIGFNFYNKSARYLPPASAKAIIGHLPEDVVKTGVFVNEMLDIICDIARNIGLNAVQLHGEEDNDLIGGVKRESGLRVMKAFRITPTFDPLEAGRCPADAILLDSYSPKERGGTGETFDWNIARVVSTVVDRVFLAGGLTPDNVAEAIRTVRPYAVDVASGVESSPGKKDTEKMRRFIEAVRNAE